MQPLSCIEGIDVHVHSCSRAWCAYVELLSCLEGIDGAEIAQENIHPPQPIESLASSSNSLDIGKSLP